MKTKSLPTLLGLTCAAAIDLAGPAAALAQDARPSTPKMTCWRGEPRPACGGFFLVEAQGVFPVRASQRPVGFPGGPVRPTDAFESRLEWNLGYMANVSRDWALGGAVSLGTGAYDALTGLRVRVRRWLGPQLSFELQGGAFFTHARNAGPTRVGITTDARLNVGDHGSFFLRWDGVDLPVQRTPTGEVWDGGGFQQALQVGVGTGSTWTLVGTGLLAAWFAIVIISLDPS